MSGSRGYRDLIVYQKAFKLAMDVFEISKTFPPDERFLLKDQIRRSSRSVCSCLAEAYRRRQYRKAFVNKVSESDMENSETVVWIEFATACGYITQERAKALEAQCDEVGRMLNSMMNSPENFCPKG